MRKVISVFLPLLFTVAMVAFPTDTISAQTTSTPQLAPPSPAAMQAGEKELIDEILRELDQARKLTNDKNIINQIGVIKDWVKKMQGLAERGETKAALEIKYTIARRLEWLINQLPLATPGTTATVAAIPAQNPLYDELVRIRAKIDKLIELEEREIPTITPFEPPEIQRPPEMEKLIVYSAKFLCGPAFGKEGVQPGSYSTAINVHNPHNNTVYLFKKAVIAQREDEPRGRISAFRKVRLAPDEAIEIDCIDIARLLGPSPQETRETPTQQTATQLQLASVMPLALDVEFKKGFVVIYATAPLDVVGVYTAGTSAGFSLDVEHIPRSTAGVLPIPIPEEPEEEVCPRGCVCLTKDDAYKRYGQNATLCQDKPCGYKDNIPFYCWKPAEQVCPTGCVCMTKDDAYKRYGQNAALCQDQPCDRDASGVLRYCWKPTEEACPQGCVCLTKDDAYNRYGQNAILCQDKPCGYKDNVPLYCWKPAEVTCPQGCYCLTKADADSRGYTTLCQEQPCAYAAGATTAMQPAKYCWKPAEVTCPQGCFCVTEAEARQFGYTLCQNQRILCGKDPTGADRYCFQRPPQITCPQGCYCLTIDDAKLRGYTDRCTDQPCGYDQNKNPIYCYKPPPQVQCPQGCYCLSQSDAKLRGYTDLCADQPCGYDQNKNPIYCYKPPPQVQCPQGCFCVTEAEAKQNGYVLCQNQRVLCGKDVTGAAKYCFQKPVYRLQ